MACSNCGNGLFSSLGWRENSSEVTLSNGVQVFFTTSGGVNTGVKVIKHNADGTTKEVTSNANGGKPYFAVWGTPQIYLAILIVSRPDAGGNTSRIAAIIDTEDHDLHSTIMVMVTLPPGRGIPFMETCPGDGSVVFTGSPGPDLNERISLGINTSNGRTNIAGVGSNIFAGQVHAKAFPDSFRI